MMERSGLRMNLKEDTEKIALNSFDDSLKLEDMKVYRSCCIDINKYGTEAAAASYEEADGLSCGSCDSPSPINFIADHPFIFMIREDTSTGTPIFLGHVVNPLQDG
ncbi:Serpin family [Parasponia andersonii]|uniref:Serpin family n=1 Tax=Parasponia andersonii TaxID=3476 RepID=A0A2P5CDE9_PARAD|nr:Serpin family [Parasponia andersonii]